MGKITQEDVFKALSNVYDMEIGFDIVSLGMIYEVKVDEQDNVNVIMTLTTPMCPLAGFITEDARSKVKAVSGVNDVKVELSFDPPWSPDMAKEEVRRVLGI